MLTLKLAWKSWPAITDVGATIPTILATTIAGVAERKARQEMATVLNCMILDVVEVISSLMETKDEERYDDADHVVGSLIYRSIYTSRQSPASWLHFRTAGIGKWLAVLLRSKLPRKHDE